MAGVQLFTSGFTSDRSSSRVMAPPGGRSSDIFLQNSVGPPANVRRFSSPRGGSGRQVRRVSDNSHHIKRKDADTCFGDSGWYSDDVSTKPLPNSSAHPTQHHHHHHHHHHQRHQQQGVGAVGPSADELSRSSAAPAAATAAPAPSGPSREEFLRERLSKRVEARQAREANVDPDSGTESLANLLRKVKLNKPEKAYVADTPVEIQKGRTFLKKGAGNARAGPNKPAGNKTAAASGHVGTKPSPKPARRTAATAAAKSSHKPARRSVTSSNCGSSGGSGGIAQSRKDAATKSRNSASARLNAKVQAETKARAPYNKKPQTRGARNSSRVLAPPGGRSTISFM